MSRSRAGNFEQLKRSGVDIEAYIPQSRESESNPEAVPGAPSGSPRDTPKGTGKGGKGGKGDSSARSTPAGTARKTLDTKIVPAAPSVRVAPVAQTVQEGSAGLAAKDVKVDMDTDKEPPLSPSGKLLIDALGHRERKQCSMPTSHPTAFRTT
jgi:hypothetical protein